MYAQTSTTSSTPASSAIRNYFARGGWPFQLSHPEGWAAVHAVVAIWLLFLGSVLLGNGYAWGALLYLGTAKSVLFAYRLIKTSRSVQH